MTHKNCNHLPFSVSTCQIDGSQNPLISQNLINEGAREVKHKHRLGGRKLLKNLFNLFTLSICIVQVQCLTLPYHAF